MTIHAEHPFAEPPSNRNPLRRWRSRLPAPVTVWATGTGTRRRGLTVSSVLIADGDPGEVIGLIDGDSEFADGLEPGGPIAISLLDQGHAFVADVFAGLAPSPGGLFRTGDWRDTDWGPAIDGASWLGARITSIDEHAGWALLARARIEQLEIGAGADPLIHLGGRYRSARD